MARDLFASPVHSLVVIQTGPGQQHELKLLLEPERVCIGTTRGPFESYVGVAVGLHTGDPLP